MAFRSQKAIGALIVLVCCGVGAAEEPVTLFVRHPHVRKGGAGEIQIGPAAILFREAGKKQAHSRQWAYEDIQQLFVGRNDLRILTYKDARWKLGSDLEYRFDQLPEGGARKILDAIRTHIDDRRLVEAVPDEWIKPLWQVKAKRLAGLGGLSNSEGVVLVGEDSVVYKSEERNASRTWKLTQIENVSSSGPFDLTITTFEQDGSSLGGQRDFRFQLKAELPEDRYTLLWRRLNQSRLTPSATKTGDKQE